jgi:uncharacterized protein YbaR (Trm112 family)
MTEDFCRLFRCPVEKCGLRRLSALELRELNTRILGGAVRLYDGELVRQPFQEALITINLKRIYPIVHTVPVIQLFESIDVESVEGLHHLFSSPPA